MNTIIHATLLLLLVFLISLPTGAVSPQVWTNENTDTLFNGPDKPTLLTFSTCVNLISITTSHWNWGTGDMPGMISLFHEDGTQYGPWHAAGVNGTHDEPNVYWTYIPGSAIEILKAGTYRISDSNPQTWAQNDASDNRGIATVVSEPVSCNGNDDQQEPQPVNGTRPAVPEEMEGAITLTPGDIDPADLQGGAVAADTNPMIEQVGFRLLSGEIEGGDPVYALLRVKNTGLRDLVDGYVSIRLVSAEDISVYRAGMGKIPVITAGEERDIPLIIPTGGPSEEKSEGTGTLLCTRYLLDGRIHELMEGGYFETRGELALSRQNLLSVIGCCQEPYTVSTLRGCRALG